MARFDEKNKVHCYILCLKMISEIIKTQIAIQKQRTGRSGPEHEFEGIRQEGLSLYVSCLINVEKLLAANLLTIQEKEVYYSEVKNLIKIIKWNQSRYMADKLRKKRVNSQIK